ncbi:MAG: hypothetical protein JWQ21_625 [Herminiimonas sp.]|nr:hypothetical protein [Herminiimonas sp.]
MVDNNTNLDGFSRNVPRPLVDDIIHHFQISLDSIHGPAHWARVRYTGLLLARETGADWKVVELFAFLHDSQRRNDGADPEHGPRAGVYARAQCGRLFDLTPEQLEVLVFSCNGHTKERLIDDVTAQTCWDADRLDLYRPGVDILPDPYYLGTTAAKDTGMMQGAIGRSRVSQHAVQLFYGRRWGGEVCGDARAFQREQHQ